MKREQAKREIDSLDFYLQNHTDDYGEYSHTAMMMAIKALEQEPCEDCVSREEAIDVCNQSINILEATDRIKDLPPVYSKVKVGKWIPVSERLPEENGEYLITWTTSQSKRPFIGISEGEVTSEYDHEFEWLLEDYVKNYPDVKVIAWMPLPKPYKAESEGEE